MNPLTRWEFDMENENIKGHWTGVFVAKGDTTEVDFTEDVVAKKVLMKDNFTLRCVHPYSVAGLIRHRQNVQNSSFPPKCTLIVF